MIILLVLDRSSAVLMLCSFLLKLSTVQAVGAFSKAIIHIADVFSSTMRFSVIFSKMVVHENKAK